MKVLRIHKHDPDIKWWYISNSDVIKENNCVPESEILFKVTALLAG